MVSWMYNTSKNAKTVFMHISAVMLDGHWSLRFHGQIGYYKILDNEIIVQLRKNAQAPILISNPVFKKSYEIPWLNNMKLKYVWK
jgi:hypothetical protein